MKKVFFLVFFVLSINNLFSQKDYPPKLYANQLVKPKTFNKLIRDDLSFLIIGESNPKQGLELEFDDDKSIITAGGYISTSKNFLTTIEGEFTSNDGGIYFFDNEGGAKTAKFTLNIYKSFFGKRSFGKVEKIGNPDKNQNDSIQRAFLKNYFFEKDTIKGIKDNYLILQEIMNEYKLPTKKENIIYSGKNGDVAPTKVEINKVKEKYLKKPKSKDKSLETIDVQKSIKKDETVRTWTISKNIKAFKLLEDYEKAKVLYDKMYDSIMKKEIEFAKPLWSKKSFWYFGFSPSYARENITLYNAESTQEFEKRFDEKKGDLFGIQLQMNWFKQTKKGKYFLARFLTNWGRGSNLSSFEKNTFGISTPSGEPIGSSPILLTESKEGYTSEDPYNYGFLQSYQLEVFGSLTKHFGLFTSLGYNKLGFDENNGLEDIEKLPFRAGGFINLTSKEETKTILVLQVFADRSNLESDPTLTNDWRFGFKIGLPVNIGKKL